ncbi:MAG: hypothetical protein M3Y86_04590 [Verrucomicrobiota bacterium]|nr:hypothetical protein [Verrucomicrobiota bacterium]
MRKPVPPPNEGQPNESGRLTSRTRAQLWRNRARLFARRDELLLVPIFIDRQEHTTPSAPSTR